MPFRMSCNCTSHFHTGSQILQQLSAQLLAIPEEVLSMGAEMMARRLELLNLVRGKHRTDRSTYLTVGFFDVCHSRVQ